MPESGSPKVVEVVQKPGEPAQKEVPVKQALAL